MLETIQELDIFEVRGADKPLDEEKVSALVESISEYGLISPIAVTSDNQLVAGAHRLAAFKRLYQEVGDVYRHIPVRQVEANNGSHTHQLETTEKLFHPELSILEKAEHFKSYFDDLKYGQDRYKTTAIFKTLDISRRTFFNLRAIAERMGENVRVRILSSSLRPLANSTPQLLALCKYDEATQLQLLDVMEKENLGTLFEAIRRFQTQVEEQAAESQESRFNPRKFLKSPSLKLDKDLREELRKLSQQSGLGQNELFNEIFAAGLELIEQKYR